MELEKINNSNNINGSVRRNLGRNMSIEAQFRLQKLTEKPVPLFGPEM
jgi:hypothetical protein